MAVRKSSLAPFKKSLVAVSHALLACSLLAAALPALAGAGAPVSMAAKPAAPATAAAAAAASAPAGKVTATEEDLAPTPKPTAPSATPAPEKGAALKSLPDFTLPDLEGKSHASGEWKGKVVLVDFWATWCAGCRETIPALARLQEKYGSQGLVVVGISLDKGPKSKVSKFTKKLKVNYQVLLDSEDTLSKVFGFEGLPSLYLFDPQGGLIKSMAGYTALQDKELEALVAAQFKAKP